jgi:hypothetical protein
MTLDTRQGIEDDPSRGEITEAKDRAQRVVKIRQELEESWRKAKETQEKWYNQKHTPRSF